jgi:SCP-2 sterol transfer family protein
MARFLSPAWFDEIDSTDMDPRHPGSMEEPGTTEGPGESLVLRQVVTDTPDGDIGYLVRIHSGRVRVERPSEVGGRSGDADVTITCDWSTAAAIAQGNLSTQKALMQGRLRVRGDVARLVGRTAQLGGLDAVPRRVRESTTY